MFVYFLVFAIFLPLVLVFIFITVACYLVGRWRFGTAFAFLTLNFIRQFAFYLAVATGVIPKQSSITYATLSTDWGSAFIGAGILIFSVWGIWDSFHNMGGIRGARVMVAQARALYGMRDRAKSNN